MSTTRRAFLVAIAAVPVVASLPAPSIRTWQTGFIPIAGRKGGKTAHLRALTIKMALAAPLRAIHVVTNKPQAWQGLPGNVKVLTP